MRPLWISLAVAAVLPVFPASTLADSAIVGPQDIDVSTNGSIFCDYFNGLNDDHCLRRVWTDSTLPSGSSAISPITGKVTSWSVKGRTTGSALMNLMVVHPQPSGKFVATSVSGDVGGFNANNAPVLFDTDQPIVAGDRIALVSSTDHVNFGEGSAEIQVKTITGATRGSFSNTFAPGSPEEPLQNNFAGEEFLFNATVESTPVTQSTGSGSGGASGGPAAGKPSISALSMSPKAFNAANAGSAVISSQVGTRVTYSLDRAATVTFSVSRAGKGRKSGRKCVKQKASNRHKKRCTRYTKLKGNFSQSGQAGQNAFTFSGRINNKALRKGRYRLEAVAVNAGSSSALSTSAFRIKK